MPLTRPGDKFFVLAMNHPDTPHPATLGPLRPIPLSRINNGASGRSARAPATQYQTGKENDGPKNLLGAVENVRDTRKQIAVEVKRVMDGLDDIIAQAKKERDDVDLIIVSALQSRRKWDKVLQDTGDQVQRLKELLEASMEGKRD